MKPNKSALSLPVFLAVLVVLAGLLGFYLMAQEQLTITTYYPSPYGVYNRLRLYPSSTSPSATCSNAGEMFYHDGSVGAAGFYLCDGSIWVPVSSYWAARGTNIYNLNTGNVGVGTNSPGLKLHVNGSGLLVSNGLGVGLPTNAIYNRNITLYQTAGGSSQRVLMEVMSPLINLSRNFAGGGSSSTQITDNSLLIDPTIGNVTVGDEFVVTGGRVGIGTVTPTARLQVVEPIRGMLAVGNSNTTAIGRWSVAIGDNVTASAINSYAFGSRVVADDNDSVIFGARSSTAQSTPNSNTFTIYNYINGMNLVTTPLYVQGSPGNDIFRLSTSTGAPAVSVNGTTGRFAFGGALGGAAQARLYVNATGDDYALYARGGATRAIYGVAGTGGVGVQGHSSNPAGYGIMGSHSNSGRGVHGQSNTGTGVYGWGINGIGVEGVGSPYGVVGRSSAISGYYDFYAGGGAADYGPFTGAHEVKLVKDFSKDVKRGMLVSVTGESQRRIDEGNTSISSTLPTVKLSVVPNDKAVLGAFVTEADLIKDHWYKPAKNERFGIINALGEGRVWVTNINGDISSGDYITSSSIAGYGQKQGDDLCHSYTVGKVIEAVDWDQVTETIEHNGKKYKAYLIALVYTSG